MTVSRDKHLLGKEPEVLKRTFHSAESRFIRKASGLMHVSHSTLSGAEGGSCPSMPV